MTAFQRDILFIVSNQNAPHGLEIKRLLEEYYDQEVNHGRLYPNLDELTELGLVSKGTYDDRTNKYELTEDGKELIQRRIEWQQKQMTASTD